MMPMPVDPLGRALETAAKLGVMSGRALEHRNFNAVIADALDVLENRPMFATERSLSTKAS